MKYLLIGIILCISAIEIKSKVKVHSASSAQLEVSKMFLKEAPGLSETDSQNAAIYVTLIEGSQDIYATCRSICRENGEETYYTEITNYPLYGHIFRCQCADKFTSWRSLYDLSKLDYNILMGDTLFNNYMTMLGYDLSDCDCNDLKALLAKLIA